MQDKPEFDSLIGGNVNLPSSVAILKYSAARCKEIQSLKKMLSTPSGTKLAFQKLPKHMRRRVMSHNAKRLPRRLQEIHLNQLKKSGMPPKQKRPSRKHRRRPKNLLAEYARRQRKIKWLNTHIWHAKRFHMINLWGYRLPDRPCDRAFRSCYRASARHCLLQDISYYNCLEIRGDEKIIVERLKPVSNPDFDLSVGAKAYLNGRREGSFMFVKSGNIPVGTIRFLWNPNIVDEVSSRTIWLWIHPAYFDEIFIELKQLFGIETNTEEIIVEGESDINSKEFNATNLYEKRLENKCTNNELGVFIRVLHDLSRFRLTGPLSNSIISTCLKFPKDKIIEETGWCSDYRSMEIPSELNGDIKSCRNNTVNKSDQNRNFLDSLVNLSSPSQLSPHLVQAVIVEDPRFNMPKIRTKAIGKYKEVFPVECDCKSPLWSEDVRKISNQSKKSNSEVADLRKGLLVPGSELEEPGAAVPILLVQRPGSKDNNNGFCSGWDIILPSSWAQPFWISLIMWGARSGGLRETESMQFEMGYPDFFPPDTKAGQQEETRLSDLNKQRFFKLPPNKRTNYNKFAISSPFNTNWKLLINEWSGRSEDFLVLRHRTVLSKLQSLLSNKKNVSDVPHDINFKESFIVPVKLTLINKGNPKKYSIVCLPEIEDLKSEPVEPHTVDENQLARKEMRKEHNVLLRKLRRQRVKAKADGKTIAVNSDVLERYKEEMENLWLPKAKTLRSSCSRKIMGFVTKGGFSYSLGQTAAVGYVALPALECVISSPCKNIVLVRNTNSRQYRKAVLEIAF